jgi:dienelactone hydrolase
MYDDSGKRLSKHMQDWADRFVAAGYVTIFPDSFTPRGEREVCTHVANIRQESERPRDAWGARTWLENQAFVRRDRIGIIGWSHGGATALWAIDRAMAAFRHGRVDFRAAVAFYPPCKAVANDASWATSTILEILIGASDDWTAASDCAFLAARAKSAAEPVSFVAFPNAYHGFDNPGQSIESLQGVLGTASRTATYGTNDAARAESIVRVMKLFDERLR